MSSLTEANAHCSVSGCLADQIVCPSSPDSYPLVTFPAQIVTWQGTARARLLTSSICWSCIISLDACPVSYSARHVQIQRYT